MKTLDELTNDMIEVGKCAHDAMLNCIWDRLSMACPKDLPDEAEVWCVAQIRLALEQGTGAYVPDFRVKGPFISSHDAFKAGDRLKHKVVLLGPVAAGTVRAHNRALLEAARAEEKANG